MNKIEQGIDYIRTHGSATGEELAKALGCPKKSVQPMLYLAINLGYLATEKRNGANLYSIAAEVPEGQSWADFKWSRKKPKDSVAPEKPQQQKQK